MCLLEEVCESGDASIRCRATSHRDPANPLRDAAGLPAICGVEYAAQAMAVHGAISERKKRPGMLVAVRDVMLHVERLDDVAGDLFVTARRLAGDAHSLMYEFELTSNQQALLRGRATVVLGESEP